MSNEKTDENQVLIVLICDPKHMWFLSVFSLDIKTCARDEFSHFNWLSNLCIINEF